MSRNRLRFAIPLAGEFAYSRFLTGSVIGQDPANPSDRIAGLLDLGIAPGRITTTAGVYLPEAHNGVVTKLLEYRDWDALVWIEHDHQFDYRLIEKLEHYSERIVGIPYYTRDAVDPRMMVGSWVNPQDPADTEPPYRMEYIAHTEAMKLLAAPGVHPIDFVPHGMTFIRREVYERLPYPWYQTGDSKELGDDVYFMGQARKHGIPVHVDSSVYAGHLTLMSVDRWWYMRERRREWLELQFGETCPPLLGGGDNARFLREGLKERMAAVAQAIENRRSDKS